MVVSPCCHSYKYPADTDSVMSSTLGLLSSCLEEASGRVRVVRPMPAEPQSEDGRVMLDGAVHLKLAHYRNKIIHLFVPEAMLVMTLQQFKSTSKSDPSYYFLSQSHSNSVYLLLTPCTSVSFTT